MQIDSPPRVLLVEEFEDRRKIVGFYLDGGYQIPEPANGAPHIQNRDDLILRPSIATHKRRGRGQGIAEVTPNGTYPIVGWVPILDQPAVRNGAGKRGVTNYVEKPSTLKDLTTITISAKSQSSSIKRESLAPSVSAV